MKFLIVLALAVVATQAAFTGSLVDQAQPLIQGLKIQALAKNSVEAKFLGQLADAISQQVSNVIGQISNAVDTVQTVAQTLVTSVETAVQQGQHIAQQAVQQAQGLLGNFISNILGAFTKNNRAIPDHVIAIIQAVANSAAFSQIQSMVHDTQLYQCLTEVEGLEIVYAHLADLYYNNQLLESAVIALPAVERCVNDQGIGSIHAVVGPYVPQIQALLSMLNIEDLVHNAIVGILGDELYQQWVGVLLNNKGLISNVINGVQSGAAQLGTFIANAAQSAIATLQEKIKEIKQMAIDFVQNGLQNAQQLTLQAAQDLVAYLQPIKEQLGALYTHVVDQLAQIHTSLVLPF